MIIFAWKGFPQYAARCVGAFVKSTTEKVVVVATRPKVPIQGMEKVCGCPVHWVDFDEKRTLREFLGEMPRGAIVSGWSSPLFNRWRDEMRRSGGQIIAMCDNNWMGWTFRECAKALRFRLLFQNKYDGFFVPGESGVKLLQFYGVERRQIETGMYSADASVFHNGIPLPERARKMIYVGQFIERKNVLRLVRAFAETNPQGWSLDLYGSGSLKSELISLAATFNLQLSAYCSRIEVHDFVQPEQLAELYRSARIFCLPSLCEHWGLVVHEAVLSGCVLLLGNRTGAAKDFLFAGRNGREFNPYSGKDIAGAMKWAMGLSDTALAEAQTESLRMAKNASLEKFVTGIRAFVGSASRT